MVFRIRLYLDYSFNIGNSLAYLTGQLFDTIKRRVQYWIRVLLRFGGCFVHGPSTKNRVVSLGTSWIGSIFIQMVLPLQNKVSCKVGESHEVNKWMYFTLLPSVELAYKARSLSCLRLVMFLCQLFSFLLHGSHFYSSLLDLT